MARVLVADDERSICDAFALLLEGEGHVPVVASTGECMEVDGASQEDNHRVVKNFCNGRYNQQWTGVPAQIGNGFFFLVARHSGKCLAILSESLVVGANLVQYACSPYSWVIDPIGGSYWRFA